MHTVSFNGGGSIVFKDCGDGKQTVGVMMLLNQTWVHLPTHSKANLLTPGCGEGKCSVYCRAPSKESRQLSA